MMMRRRRRKRRRRRRKSLEKREGRKIQRMKLIQMSWRRRNSTQVGTKPKTLQVMSGEHCSVERYPMACGREIV